MSTYEGCSGQSATLCHGFFCYSDFSFKGAK